jgi:hypothetical protein
MTKRAVAVHLERFDRDDEVTGYWAGTPDDGALEYGPFESRFINADFYGHLHFVVQLHYGPPHLRLGGPVLMFITLSDTEVWVGLRGSRIGQEWSDGVPLSDLLSFDGGAVALVGWLRADGGGLLHAERAGDCFRVALFPSYLIL